MDYLEIEKKLGANNYKPMDVVLNRGEGIWYGMWMATATWTACLLILP
jgi:hypothetical protein